MCAQFECEFYFLISFSVYLHFKQTTKEEKCAWKIYSWLQISYTQTKTKRVFVEMKIFFYLKCYVIISTIYKCVLYIGNFLFLLAWCRCEVNYNYGRKFSLRFSLCVLKSDFCVQLNDLVLFWFIGALTHYVTRESFIDVISTV